MYEYEIMNKTTKETTIIFGYSFENACKRANINGNDYDVLMFEYVD